VGCCAARALEDSVRPRRALSACARPVNFTVRSMLTAASRILLGAELAAVALATLVTAIFLGWGLMGLNLESILWCLTFFLFLLASFAIARLALPYVQSGLCAPRMNDRPLWYVAVLGPTVAAVLAVYDSIHAHTLDEALPFDLARISCLSWIPLIHIGVVGHIQHRSNNRWRGRETQ
jgi:hypothetical protein